MQTQSCGARCILFYYVLFVLCSSVGRAVGPRSLCGPRAAVNQGRGPRGSRRPGFFFFFWLKPWRGLVLRSGVGVALPMPLRLGPFHFISGAPFLYPRL